MLFFNDLNVFILCHHILRC